MNENAIIEKIKSGGKAHDEAIGYIYRTSHYKDPATAYFRSKGISRDNTNILWTDLVIQLGKLIINGKYTHQGNLTGYIVNLARYMSLNHYRDNKKYNFVDLDEKGNDQPVIQSLDIYNEELKSLLVKELEEAGSMCKDILYLWARDYSMTEIKDKLNLISVEATRKRKHTCLKKLLLHIEQKTDIQEQLKNYL